MLNHLPLWSTGFIATYALCKLPRDTLAHAQIHPAYVKS